MLSSYLFSSETTMIKTEEFKKWLVILLAETFGVSDSPHGFMLDDGKAGLLGTINGINAATASSTLKPDRETIASHCGHILFLLRLYDAYEQGQRPEHDWVGSWATHEVDDAAWDTLRTDVQTAYEAVIQHIHARDEWIEPPLSASMILLAHCAYHVGEIKQLLTSLS